MFPMSRSKKRAKLDISGREGDVSVDGAAARARILYMLQLDPKDPNCENRHFGVRVDDDWLREFDDVDWTGAFTKQGHLRLPFVTKMLPQVDDDDERKSSSYLHLMYQNLKFAVVGLMHFNKENKSAQYDLVKPIFSSPTIKEAGFYFHCNFLGKPVNDANAPAELFYADVFTDGTVKKAISSCILPPSLYPSGIAPPLENADFLKAYVAHPPGVVCNSCKWSDDLPVDDWSSSDDD